MVPCIIKQEHILIFDFQYGCFASFLTSVAAVAHSTNESLGVIILLVMEFVQYLELFTANTFGPIYIMGLLRSLQNSIQIMLVEKQSSDNWRIQN